ncbi:MAG TPA: hypothetical protein VH596_07520 [Terriglobales bacterium]|jgi:hypothetical protein
MAKGVCDPHFHDGFLAQYRPTPCSAPDAILCSYSFHPMEAIADLRPAQSVLPVGRSGHFFWRFSSGYVA